MLTLQGIYDIAVSRMLIQNKKSIFEGYCYYRHPTNNKIKCGIGHLILDEYYTRSLERKGVSLFLNKIHIDFWKYNRIDITQQDVKVLLCKIQGIHDKYHVNDWRKAFKCLANDYFNLDDSIINTVDRMLEKEKELKEYEYNKTDIQNSNMDLKEISV